MHDGADRQGPCPTCGCDPRAQALLEARYRALTENFPNGIIALYEHDLRFVVVHGTRQTGPDSVASTLVGRRLRDVFPPEVYERDEPSLLAALRGESTESIVAYAGQWFRVLTLPVRDADGEVIQGMVMSQNITRLKQTELRLEGVVDRLSLAVRTAGLGIWELDVASGALSWGDEAMAIYGVRPADFGGTVHDWRRRVHPDDRERAVRLGFRVAGGQRLEGIEYRIVRPDGEVRHLRTSCVPLDASDGGVPRRVVGVDQDVTPLRRGIARLRESEARYRSLFEYASDAVALVDDEGCIVEVNPAASAIMGLPAEQFVGRRAFDYVVAGDDDDDSFWSGLRRDGVRTASLDVQRGDGELRYLAVSARADVQPGLHLVVVRDVTEQRRVAAEQARLEARNQQAQKLEAVGLLTGGVAHDFNNLLHVILAQTELATLDLEADHPALESLDDVRAAAERAQRMVAQLLAFARKQVLRPQPLHLDGAVGELVRMLGPLLGGHIRIDWQPGGGPAVHADLSTVEQVVMNLCLNARDAMPDGGVLRLRTRAAGISPSEAGALGIEPGHFVELAVQDDGVGMPPEVVARVFDPFFTTKAEGTGMGLATVYGIVRQHGGAIWVDSTPGVGTTFSVLWPETMVDASEPPPPVTAEPTRPRPAARILLAEDEPLVAKVTARYLRQAGYTVLLASNGAEAVELARDRGDEIDLALLDILMPVMTGPTAYARIAAERPALPVVFMSGYADLSPAARQIVDARPLVRKPFGRRDLLDAVRDALAAGAPAR